MSTPWSERGDYYVLPDDPVESLNIVREAAGLQSLSDEHDDQGGFAGLHDSG